MNKRIVSHISLAALLALTPVLFFAQSAAAEDTPVQNRQERRKSQAEREREIEKQTELEKEREVEREVEEQKRESVKTVAAEKKELQEQRLEVKKLKVCENKQTNFKSMMQKISDRGTKQLSVFKAIADKTMAFYKDKGYSAAGYEALVKEVDAQYAASLAAVSTTQASKDSWSCGDANPIGAMQVFRDAKKKEVAALKAYKDKVRELIVLVKQAAKASEGGVL